MQSVRRSLAAGDEIMYTYLRYLSDTILCKVWESQEGEIDRACNQIVKMKLMRYTKFSQSTSIAILLKEKWDQRIFFEKLGNLCSFGYLMLSLDQCSAQ